MDEADAPPPGSRARTVRLCGEFAFPERSPSSGAGQSARSRHERRHPGRPLACAASATKGDGLGPASRWRVARTPPGARDALSCSPVLEAGGWCLRRRRGASETGTLKAKAAPAHPARAVHRARRRKAPASREPRGSATPWKRPRSRAGLERIGRSWPRRRARPSCPSVRAARTVPDRAGTLTTYGTMRGSRHARTIERETAGPNARYPFERGVRRHAASTDR